MLRIIAISLSPFPALLALMMLSGALAAEPEGPMVTPRQMLMDFSDTDEVRWYAVNDGVMGGLSQGAPMREDGQLRFSGVLSLANNGGFSSVRTTDQVFDLSGIDALQLRVKGDGRNYQLRLATDARFRGSPVSYGATFSTEVDRWINVRIPLEDLKPSYRGYQLEGPPLNPARVQEIGLLIGDKREGPFTLMIDWIAAE
jgi:monofunctional biosynthetic peptidoglycan transglycosylase